MAPWAHGSRALQMLRKHMAASTAMQDENAVSGKLSRVLSLFKLTGSKL
jgi:hypothetical protein